MARMGEGKDDLWANKPPCPGCGAMWGNDGQTLLHHTGCPGLGDTKRRPIAPKDNYVHFGEKPTEPTWLATIRGDFHHCDVYTFPNGSSIRISWPKKLNVQKGSQEMVDLIAWFEIVTRKIERAASPDKWIPASNPPPVRGSWQLYRCECGAQMTEDEHEYSKDHVCGGRWIPINQESDCIHCQPNSKKEGVPAGPLHAVDCPLWREQA